MILRDNTPVEPPADNTPVRRLQRRRRFWTRSDLPRWLAPFVGGADVQIREDARWRTDRDGARLELYTENESHVGLIAVREWCTYAADGEAPHTRARKMLHITARMVLRPWWLLGAERKLEAFLVRRWLHALQLGLAADDALCAEVAAERAAGVAEPQ